MKLVSLKIQRSRSNHNSLARQNPESHEIHTYAELRQKIHNDLRVQHPEWIQPDGESPMCDSYEARLMQVLDNLTSKQSIVDPHRLLEQGAH
jgi:nitrogenase subunit NifH